MKKIASTIICFLFLISCGIKKNQGLLNTGNYDEVIDNSIESLRYNKEKKANQDYIYLLEEAFAKAKERELNSINLWKKENHPSNFEKIYNTYLALNDRQEKIKPLLPLKLLIEGRNAIFPFENYNENIIKSKNSFCDFLYTNATFLLSTTDKMNFRRAHDELLYLNQLNPNYKNVNTLIRESLNKGTDYINVSTINETNMVIPVRLLNDLLDFSTYGLNNKWTVFETTKQKGIKYDYAMIINFRDIIISNDYACLMHLDGFIKKKLLPLRIMHIADVLASGW